MRIARQGQPKLIEIAGFYRKNCLMANKFRPCGSAGQAIMSSIWQALEGPFSETSKACSV